MENLAVTYYQLGRYQEAEALEVIVLEKQKQLLGVDHPKTLAALRYLVAIHYKLGEYQETKKL
jgi:hypothetical protein